MIAIGPSGHAVDVAEAAPRVALAPLRYSRLKLMAKSPAHCRFALDQDLAGVEDWDDTPSRRLGRLAHAVFLEQPLPVVFPGPRRAGKEWDAFKAANADREIVKQEELETALAMAAALRNHDEARELLRGGDIERTIFYELAGRACRSTPDVHWNGKHLTDLKSTTDASPERFPWQALKLGYHGQMAMQFDAILAVGMKMPARIAIVAVENRAPFVVNVFPLTPDAIEFGRRVYRSYFEQFLVCEQNNHWPGYAQGVLTAPPDSEGFGGDELED